jgi:transcriptional regulator with XRE-family HTH domain
MTPAQLQKLLDSAGLSQRGAAKAIEINERTMRKYVAGESAIPRTVEYALRWAAQDGHPDGTLFQKQGGVIVAMTPDGRTKCLK